MDRHRGPSLETLLKLILLLLGIGLSMVMLGLRLYSGYEEYQVAAEEEIERMQLVVRELSFENTDEFVRFTGGVLKHWKVVSDGGQGDHQMRTQNGITLWVVLDGRGIWESLIESNKLMFICGIVALLAFLQIAALLAYSVTRPLQRLEWGFERMSLGESVRLPPCRYSARELKMLTDKFNEMALEIDQWHDFQKNIVKMERLAMLGDMSASLAHEMRNPMATLKMQLDLLRIAMKDEHRYDEYLANFEEELDNMGAKLDQFLDFSRKGSSRRVLVDTVALLRDAADALRATATERGVAIRTLPYSDEAVEAHAILGDPDVLKQLLVNVGMNGILSMEEGGVLTVSLNFDEAHAVYTFDDNGCGVPENLGRKIFEPFVTTRPDCTGLGLAIAKKGVEDHNGSIDFASSKYGTSFIVTFPIYVQGRD